MTQKLISEKNLWQRLPVRWRVIFLFLALLAASYGVRHLFPMTPDLRENQKSVEVDELFVESVWESADEAVAETDGAKTPKVQGRVSGLYVSKLLPTGKKIRIAYAEYTPENVEMPAPPNVPATGDESVPAEDESVLDRAAAKAGKLYDSSKRAVSKAWKNWRDGVPAHVPVLLLHGAALDGSSLDAMAREIVRTGAATRVIVPDLPGAGASSRDVADYSIESAAGEMFELLNALEIKEVNVLGFGNGGGAAIYMAHRAPERVKSLALVSSVGAQEFELLGNHIVNKIVYTFHLGFFKLVQDVFPHFGLMDAGNVNKAFARMLWDSDISELKKNLREWNGPLFLAHGENDLVTDIVAAQYTAKLAPQAETHFVHRLRSAMLTRRFSRKSPFPPKRKNFPARSPFPRERRSRRLKRRTACA